MVDERVAELVSGVLAGERRALARALTLVEDGSAQDLRGVVGGIFPRTGRAAIVGVTGSPGVGKSTLTNAMAAELRRRDRTVGIIAVDPSSPFSGGALLGDRVRMQAHHADAGVFIRSMAARGHLGGLSFATPQAALVLDAAGFDVVVIETVGVGQSEVEVAATADTTIVTVAPGMGDSIQAAKAGILEVADVFVINKADHEGTRRVESDLKNMLELGHVLAGPDEEAGWQPPILRTVAPKDEGIPELVDAVEDHHRHLEASGQRRERQEHRALHAVREIALERIRERFHRLEASASPSTSAASADDPLLVELATQVADRDLDPYTAADRLLDALGA